MRIYRIDRPRDPAKAWQTLGCEKKGAAIMAQKSDLLFFALKALPVAAANILKQDALSVGAELAVPRGTVTCQKEKVDAVLMGTPRQLRRLARKEKAQPFGLAKVGHAVEEALAHTASRPVRIMGVINANDDSFYPASRFKEGSAVAALERMIEEGADIIDIGGVSSRPGSDPVPEAEELARVAPILEAIRRERLYERALFSIDSYAPAVIARALESGFKMVNDITGLSNDAVGELAGRYGARLVIMHMRGTPKTMQENPDYDDVVAEVDAFFAERIERAEALGLAKEALVLDVGIGFGKRLADNLALLKHHAHFLHFGCELLIGASRKSMIDALSPAPVTARLPGTLAIHLEAVRRGASIVRCHDVAEHRQALTLQSAIEQGGVE